MVSDVELVCIPRPERRTGFLRAAMQFGRPKHQFTATTRYFRIDGPDISFDLFLPMPYDWGRILALRTGSAEWVTRHLASAWVRRGYRGTSKGLLPENMLEKKGDTWSPLPAYSREQIEQFRIPFFEEEDLFTWLGLPWLEPEKRSL